MPGPGGESRPLSERAEICCSSKQQPLPRSKGRKMDGNAINRPEPPGHPRDAVGVVGTSFPGAHRAEEPQSPLTLLACRLLLQGPGSGGPGRDCWQGVRLPQVSASVKTGYLVVLHDSRHMWLSVHKIHLLTGASRKMTAASSSQPPTSAEWTVGICWRRRVGGTGRAGR